MMTIVLLPASAYPWAFEQVTTAWGAQTAEMRRSMDVEGERARVEAVYSARGYDTDTSYSDVSPVYLHRVQSMERAYLSLLQELNLSGDLASLRILDHGCGNGRWLGRWIAWGADPQNLAGIDIRRSAIDIAQHNFPTSTLFVDVDARHEIDDGSFDVLAQNLVFSSILDDSVRRSVAQEMTRPGGLIIICDFCVGNPKNPDVKPLKMVEVKQLFSGCKYLSNQRLVLAPPLARRVVPLSWLAADLLERCVPILRTHRMHALRREA
jgi:2-polyprenyl-3-methyl-5-hydroxy-6-metoxy-1,4-benzoquinol methylase